MIKRPTTLIWVAVHQCEVCGDHAEEVIDSDGSCFVEGIYLRKCDTCKLLACWSCLSDGHCCDRRAEIESEGKPPRGQGKLFDERLLMQDGAEPESAKET